MHLIIIFLFTLLLNFIAIMFCNIVSISTLYSISYKNIHNIQDIKDKNNVFKIFKNKINDLSTFLDNNKNKIFAEYIDFTNEIDPLILILMVIF